MSVASLSNTRVNIYSVTTTQDAFAANLETYTLKYGNIPARIRYLNGQSTFLDGKEMNPAIYRIYLPKQFNVIASDLIISIKNKKYDILYVNKTDRKRHMQVDVKYVTSILGDSCPNIINAVSASVVTAPQAFPFFEYVTCESNGSNTKNHFIQTYTGATAGYTSSDKTFFGDYNVGGVNPSPQDSYQLLLVNGSAYWLHMLTGVATTSCCSDLYGQNIPNS
jgi:head-tail adaptor